MKFICIWAFPEASGRESGLRFLPNDKGNLAVGRCGGLSAGPPARAGRICGFPLKNASPSAPAPPAGAVTPAAVLRGLNLLTNAGLSLQDLARIGAAVGSDVPYCVLGGTALAQGRGGNVNPAARPARLLVRPM